MLWVIKRSLRLLYVGIIDDRIDGVGGGVKNLTGAKAFSYSFLTILRGIMG
jgi:hypothetical protein